MNSTVILIPVLGRPHRIAPILESIAKATPEPHRILFICSPADYEVHAAIDAHGAERLTVGWEPNRGDYARKINLGYRETVEPFMFLGADDLLFHPGWLPAAIRCVRARTGVVGTQDLANPRVLRREHSTHSLVVRAYVDEFGTIDEPDKILHEGYWHEFCDDELVETAKHRDAWAFAAKSIVEHLHPMVDKMPTDPLYDQQKLRMHRSRPLLIQRRRLWGGR